LCGKYQHLMQKLISISLLILFTLSIFLISNHFVNPPAPTPYIAAGGCCVFSILAIVLRYKQQSFSLSATEALLGGFLMFSIVYGAYSGSINLEWIISGFSLFLFYLLVKRINLTLEWLFTGFVVIGIAQAIYGLGQYLHWFNNIVSSGFRISGSFDNPAGFAAALSVCFSFALFISVKKELYWKIFGVLAALLFVIAIVLSQSRAGVITIIVISGFWAMKTLNLSWLKSCSNRTKIVGSVALIITILIGLYFLKKDSADGRLLIWQCSGQMIADKPFLGHGAGGFQREYMLYQADYFRAHPASSYAMRADIVKHPFNEYLMLLVEQGLMGGILLGFLVYMLQREYRRNRSNETFYAMLCLVGIGVFACFSYPLGYPFVRLMVVFCVANIMRNETKGLKISNKVFGILKPTILVVSVVLLSLTGKMFYDEYRWNTIAQRSLAGETKEVMSDYARLYKTMNRNGLFLYNYAAELNFIDRNVESNRLFIEASHFMNDIDLQLQMADNYQKMRNYKEAEKCLILASDMIPNRFIPLYRLAKLYEVTNQQQKARKTAKLILKKPVKIMSPNIVSIRIEMQQLINKEGRKQI